MNMKNIKDLKKNSENDFNDGFIILNIIGKDNFGNKCVFPVTKYGVTTDHNFNRSYNEITWYGNLDRMINDAILYDVDIYSIHMEHDNITTKVILYDKLEYEELIIPEGVTHLYLLSTPVKKIKLPSSLIFFRAHRTHLNNIELPNTLESLTLLGNHNNIKYNIPTSIKELKATPDNISNEILEKYSKCDDVIITIDNQEW